MYLLQRSRFVSRHRARLHWAAAPPGSLEKVGEKGTSDGPEELDQSELCDLQENAK